MKENRLSPYVPAIGHCLNDTAQGSLPALLPYFIHQLGLTYYEAGSLMFIFTVVASVAQPFFGYLADKIQIRLFIPIGITLATGCVATMALATTYTELLVLCFIAGIGSAVFHPEAALLVRNQAKTRQGKAMGLFAVGGNAGFAIGPIIASGIYIWGAHYLLVYWLIALLGISLFQYGVGIGSRGESVATLETKKITGTNNWKGFSILSIIIAARSTCFTVLNTFIPLFWITVLMQSVESGNTALTLFFTVGTLLTYVGGYVSDRIGFIQTIRLGYVILVPSLYFFLQSSDPLWAMILALPVVAGVFTQYGPIVVLGQAYLPENAGFASGITLGLGVTFGGLVAPLIGAYADIHGIADALLLIVPFIAIALVASFFLPKVKTA